MPPRESLQVLDPEEVNLASIPFQLRIYTLKIKGAQNPDCHDTSGDIADSYVVPPVDPKGNTGIVII